MKIIQYMLGIRNADGGVVRAFVDLCQVLAARGHEVVCLTTDDRDAARDWDGQGGRPKLVTLPPTRMFSQLFDRTDMDRVCQLFAGADIVHLHVPWDPICAQLARSCRRMQMPYIMSLHGMLDDWTVAKGSFKKRVYLSIAGRTMLERASWVHCTAEIEKLQSSKWYPKGRTVVAPLPFDLLPYQSLTGPQLAHERFQAALKTDASKWLFVGRLHPIKRIELLLEACRILADQGTHGHALIAGSGDREYEQTLRAKVNELELTDRVFFLGFVTGREKTSLYQAVDGVILPSAHESFGYSAIEALACGTPVITTKAVNIWQELQQSGGAVIAGGYADELALAMARINAMPDSRAQLGQCGQRWVFDQLHPDRVAVQYEQMYRNAANG